MYYLGSFFLFYGFTLGARLIDLVWALVSFCNYMATVFLFPSPPFMPDTGVLFIFFILVFLSSRVCITTINLSNVFLLFIPSSFLSLYLSTIPTF